MRSSVSSFPSSGVQPFLEADLKNTSKHKALIISSQFGTGEDLVSLSQYLISLDDGTTSSSQFTMNISKYRINIGVSFSEQSWNPSASGSWYCRSPTKKKEKIRGVSYIIVPPDMASAFKLQELKGESICVRVGGWTLDVGRAYTV